MQKESQTYTLIRWGAVLTDVVVLNVLLTLFMCFVPRFATPLHAWYAPALYVIFSLIYIACAYAKPPVFHLRNAKANDIFGRVVAVTVTFAVLSFLIINYLRPRTLSGVQSALFYLTFALTIILTRYAERMALRNMRRMGRNRRDVLFVGSRENMIDLYDEMMSDPTMGFNVLGYFDDEPIKDKQTVGDNADDDKTANDNGFSALPYLGTVDSIADYIARTGFLPTGRIYCGLPSKRAKEIKQLIAFCENHLIRFYSVPHLHSAIYRTMHMDFVGDVPVLYLREEPLRKPLNRLLKRLFDIVFALGVLCTVFVVAFLFVAVGTLISDPGPIFFRQKRHGLNGKEFYCYKFRSMRVNDDADKQQATKDDPRKTRFGNFLRKSNIDELPQFFNVLKGDMSVVGPRPHMLKHTEEYSELIKNYMVRHFVRPGITGYAQVMGCRGETQEVWQMEERIKKDIWYIENWSFWLDIRIIYLTVRNIFIGDEKAY